jgi:hypothetical protein
VSDQPLHLFDVPTVPRLTARQQFALNAITGAGFDGLQTEELGALLHYPKHGLHETCEWCGSVGMQMGRALRAKGLVQQRRRQAPGRDIYMVWVAAGTPARRPVDREYDLPEGY